METLTCPACKIKVYENPDFCDNCKYPFIGSEKEKSIHIGKFISKKGVVQDSSNALGNVQKILFFLGGLNILTVIIMYSSTNSHWLDLALNGFLALVFIFCAIFLKKAPLLFTILPLATLLGVYTLNAVIDPMSLVNGIIIKVLIVGSLIYSMYLSLKARKFQKLYKLG
ncbi:hypothetical protein [Marinirhabdus gelatinilytica]|uniref:Uncharacterized protein n=1 Tax=Marinirhabdus gelatinilytica TaxID=1703343 RepID=A0A370Q917_9FLAO|nr:hypothetical protein [Marinirhabdus gelatinilytica]RDK84857.1 hypothetical protein C8D94_104232 [Marinirhabdus gelatinilytica]